MRSECLRFPLQLREDKSAAILDRCEQAEKSLVFCTTIQLFSCNYMRCPRRTAVNLAEPDPIEQPRDSYSGAERRYPYHDDNRIPSRHNRPVSAWLSLCWRPLAYQTKPAMSPIDP
jgi:hypothetical protein